MAYNVTSQIFDYMDTVVAEFVASNLSLIIQTVTPLIGLGLTMALMVRGLYGIISPGGEPLSDLLQRFVGFAIIISIASAGGWYQTDLANVALKTPDEFASVLIVNGENGGQQEKIASTIDQAIDKTLDTAKTAFENAGFTSGAGIASAFLGCMVLLTSAFVCGVGAGLILMAKFLLGITVCFGPIFIYCLLFDATKDLFTKWIGSIINFSLVTILLAAVFGLMIKFYAAAIQAAASGDTPILVPVFTASLLAVVSWFVLKNIPEMAASWGQGISAQFKPGRQRQVGGGGGGGGKDSGGGGSSGGDANGGAAGAAAGAAAGGPAGAAAGAAGGKARGSRAG
ncbi:type IV secretion system protein [Pseudomonas corrugata]|uniref:type IV secretion system protein n=1 Tax=Pseudomonas corrugata TaxID=47879 RepID=UPI0028C3D019|nr:type IV secretion system protein [Pseudomonas corrugata]MDU9042793.1 type IV secretion system protein [Pseudomonas corrugata]